jgi:hypothetical protein
MGERGRYIETMRAVNRIVYRIMAEHQSSAVEGA